MITEPRQFVQLFFEESLEGLEQFESALLNLESGDAELVHTIFRVVHSIKGGSATFGIPGVAEFTHVLETVLDRMRSGQQSPTPDLVALLLECGDCTREMLEAARDGDARDAKTHHGLQRKLEEFVGTSDPARQIPRRPVAEGESERAPTRSWKIRFRPLPHLMKTGNDPLRILRELGQLGSLQVRADLRALPPFSELDAEECHIAWDLMLETSARQDQIRELFAWVEGDCELSIQLAERSAESRSADPSPSTGGAARSSGFDGASVRVDIEKVDALINMVGELVITQSMLGQLGTQITAIGDGTAERLQDGLVQLERTTRELQESVMRIRMLPISYAFNRVPRLVHDLSKQLGKKVRLSVSGGQTELDKTVLEKIGDPLVHLVRNALDHGIESPDVRQQAGKPETGTISLNAFHRGGNIIIEVHDDGRGLDRERILARGRERGLIGPDETPPNERIVDMIFQPGFSTADRVSEVSGRGVGMDVVRRNIKELGGSVEVRPNEGQGTCFTIRLPLTLAIMDGQLIRVADHTYIIPLTAIRESLQMSAECLSVVAGEREIYRLRDDYIPVLRMRGAFGIADGDDTRGEQFVVVVEGGGRTAGLVVDELLGQQQVVIKSLDTNFRPIPALSGATILGDGTVALIADVSELLELRLGKSGCGATYRSNAA